MTKNFASWNNLALEVTWYFLYELKGVRPDKLHTVIFCPDYYSKNRLWIFGHDESYLSKIHQPSTVCLRANLILATLPSSFLNIYKSGRRKAASVHLVHFVREIVTTINIAQRPRVDLNKRFLPRPNNTTVWKLIPHRSKISKNWNPPHWVPLHRFFKNWFLLIQKQLYSNYIQTHFTK